MSKEETTEKIDKTKKKIEEMIKSCPLYLQKEYDLCNEKCPVYEYCWNLQDEEEKLAKIIESTMPDPTEE